MDIAQLGVEVKTDGLRKASVALEGFKKDADKATGATDKFTKAQQAASPASSGFARSVSTLRSGLAGLAGALAVGAFIKISSEMTDFRARLERVTGGAEQGAAAMDRLQQMAKRTYSSFSQTAEGYLQTEGALRSLGYTTEQTMNFVETLNNALVVSGSKGDRAASVMYALQKAMAVGKLSGDNLNSVLANGGRITELLAEHLGLTTNQLRDAGEQGKITGQVLYEALAGNMQKIREEAEKMPATIMDGLTQIGRAFGELVDKFNQQTGAGEKVAAALLWVADNMETIAKWAAVLAVGGLVAMWPMVIAGASAAISLLARIITQLIAISIENPFMWVAAATAAVVLFSDKITIGAGELTTLADVGNEVWLQLKDGAEGAALGMGESFAMLGEDFKTHIKGMGAFFGITMSGVEEKTETSTTKQEATWVSMVRYILSMFDMLGGAIRGIFAAIGTTLAVLVDRAKRNFSVLGEMAQAAMKLDWKEMLAIGSKDIQHAKDSAQAIADAWTTGIADSLKLQGNSGLVSIFDEGLAAARKKRAAAGGEGGGGGVGGGGGGGGAGKGDDKALKAALDSTLKAIELATKMQVDALEDRNRRLGLANDQGLISISSYYSQLQEIAKQTTAVEVAGYSQQIAALQAYMAKVGKGDERIATQEKINDLLYKRNKLESDGAFEVAKLAVEQAKAMEALKNSVTSVNVELLTMQGELAKAAALSFDLQNAERKKLLSANGESGALAQMEALRTNAINQARINQLTQEYSLITDTLGLQEERIALAQQLGTTGAITGMQQVGALRLQAIAQLETQLAIYQAMAATDLTGQQVLEVERLRLELDKLRAAADPLKAKFDEVFQTGFSNAFAGVISGTKTLGDAFKDLANTIVQEINKIVAKEMASKIFGGMGGGNSFGGLISGLFGGGGGDPLGDFIGGLPSFDVGTPYVQQDQVAQIHKGERILTAKENQQYTNGDTAGGGGTMTINNTFVLSEPASKQTQAQVAAMAAQALQRAQRRNS